MTSSPPLDGLRIIDLSSVVMGPFATQILGDLGADVIKVEPHQGDTTRHVTLMSVPGRLIGSASAGRRWRRAIPV